MSGARAARGLRALRLRMPTSLRARLLTGVLLLSAAGLVVVGAVTYSDQRSFLEGRADQQVRSAAGAISEQLDAKHVGPAPYASGESPEPGAGSFPGGGGGGGGFRPPRSAGLVNLPPGTFGERRLSDGRVLGEPIVISYGTAVPSPPKVPVKVPVERLFTLPSSGNGPSYRAYVQHDPEDPGLTLTAVPLTELSSTLNRLLLVEGLVIGGVLLALTLLGLLVVRLGLRPLDRMEATAGAIAAGDLSRRVSPATPDTEVGRLGIALNRMLDRLEEAFAEREASEERLRRFLADASHELRTPLASIRGYAELFRMGATDSEGTETAMRRIEEEARRMGVLVEDLLKLARLDEGRELRRGQVDVADMARDAATDARATAPEREIDVAAPASAIVEGDPDQLHQVLANLMSNALRHTPDGTAVDVSVRQDDGRVELSVRDHGAGLPDGDQRQLFERFWRAASGRERGRAGAGLGLAIAREIVAAHHGTIDAGNAPGGGAVFTVTLPAKQPHTDGRPRTQPAEQ
jgi:two-component system OmpR family sensor kinase